MCFNSELIETQKQPSHLSMVLMHLCVVAWYYPQYCSTNITCLLSQGANFIMPVSGCMIVSWVVMTWAWPKALKCHGFTHEHQVLQGKEHLVQEYYTIHVAAKIWHISASRLCPKYGSRCGGHCGTIQLDQYGFGCAGQIGSDTFCHLTQSKGNQNLLS